MNGKARCGRSDAHGAHVIDRGEDGTIHAWCMGTPLGGGGYPAAEIESLRKVRDAAARLAEHLGIDTRYESVVWPDADNEGANRCAHALAAALEAFAA